MGIYEDYAKLRGKMSALQKSGKNPHFNSRYVKLNTVIDEVDENIKDSGFVCFISLPTVINGKNYLHTDLIHTNGEKISCDLELITTKQDPQMLGSSLTYMRRYSLITLLGLQDEDDDANVGSGKEAKPEAKPVPKQSEADKPEKATKEQLDEIARLAKLKGSLLANISKSYKVASCADLTFAMAKEVIAKLKLKENV